jgi:hypothetical protein
MFNVNFRVNDNYHDHKRAFIVDNFYHNPMAVREFAIDQTYVEGGIGRGFIGRRSEKQFLFPGLKESFEDILGLKITAWEEHGMNGRFQLNMAGEPVVYHCDSQRFAAMIFLTPNAPPESGTSTFMHKESRVFHNSSPDIMKAFGNIFNRLVIFNGGCIHGASTYFGSSFEDGRLWHMFFFDAE